MYNLEKNKKERRKGNIDYNKNNVSEIRRLGF